MPRTDAKEKPIQWSYLSMRDPHTSFNSYISGPPIIHGKCNDGKEHQLSQEIGQTDEHSADEIGSIHCLKCQRKLNPYPMPVAQPM